MFALMLKNFKGPKYTEIYSVYDFKKIIGVKQKFFKPPEYVEAGENDTQYACLYSFLTPKGVLNAVPPKDFTLEYGGKGTLMVVWESFFNTKCLPVKYLEDVSEEREEEVLIGSENNNE